MPEPIPYALGAIAILGACILALRLIGMGMHDWARWLDRRADDRAQRLERELVKTKEVLALVSEGQATLLDARAHEAAVAMILASYRASSSIPSEYAKASDGRADR